MVSRPTRARSRTSCSRAMPEWVRAPWAPRCFATRSRRPESRA
ncbi:hypothetical protein ACFPRL_25295 [Pseudoclavibacter helvolus]